MVGYGERVNPALRILPVPETLGDGLETGYDWLRDARRDCAAER